MSEDHWDFYMTLVDGNPASIFANLSLIAHAPIAEYGHFLFVQVPMLNPREDGLSSAEEFDQLIAIEDRIVDTLQESGGAIYVGRNTTDGVRDLFFYVRDADAATKVVDDLAPELSPYALRTGGNDDAEWGVYRSFVYPGPDDLQHINNRSVLRQLAEHGDDHAAAREIDHFAYFPNVDAASSFAQEMARQRFVVADSRDQNEQGDHCVAFKREDSLTDIDEITINLAQLADEHGGYYDGWGCPVMKPE